MFQLNKDRCIQCGQCARVCPFTCITLDSGYPDMAPKKQRACVKCLHCAAICPTEAIAFPGLSCEPMVPWEPGETAFLQTKNMMLTRRSIRNFKKDPVPRSVIEEVLRTSDFAPSARNQQPQSWLVVHKPETVAKVMKLVVEWVENKHISMEILSELERQNNIVTLDAPHLLIGIGPRAGKMNPYTDTVIALRDIDLLFHSRGIGTCWAGYLANLINASLELRAYLGIPADLQVYGAMAFGYPDNETYQRLPYKGNPPVQWK